ncbi:MAG TPA: hypothetical protein DEH78_08970 [Solibacterales bacterium]|nr:hypothetical protein [Bryobacterales bacterium]
MFTATTDALALIQRVTDIERKHLPFVLRNAMNAAAFDVKQGWARDIGTVFDRPKPLTMNAVLYTKATADKPIAEIFLRNEASKGTPPSRYLARQVWGGPREHKPFEFLLREKAGILGGDEFIVPARTAPLDPYGNVPAGVVRAILSDLAVGRGEADADAFSTRETRAKRAKRNRKKEGAGVYWYERGDRGKLPRGIFERLNRAFVGPRRAGASGGARMIFAIVKGAPEMGRRLRVYEISERLFREAFPARFRELMTRALATAKPGRR